MLMTSCKKQYPSNDKFTTLERVFKYDELFKNKSISINNIDEIIEYQNIDTTDSKEYLYKLEYFSTKEDKELIWGTISMVIKIGKTKLDGNNLWIPYELHGKCWSANENIKMFIEPKFKYLKKPENKIMTWMYLGSSIGDSNSKSKLISHANSSELIFGGTIFSNAIHLNLISKEEDIEIIPHRNDVNIDTLVLNNDNPILKTIFNTDKEIQRKQISIIKK